MRAQSRAVNDLGADMAQSPESRNEVGNQMDRHQAQVEKRIHCGAPVIVIRPSKYGKHRSCQLFGRASINWQTFEADALLSRQLSLCPQREPHHSRTHAHTFVFFWSSFFLDYTKYIDMKLHVLVILSLSFATLLSGETHAQPQARFEHAAQTHRPPQQQVVSSRAWTWTWTKRQINSGAGSQSGGGGANGAKQRVPVAGGSSNTVTGISVSPPLAPSAVSYASSTIGGSKLSSSASSTMRPTPVVSVPPGGQNGARPLSLISSGMSTGMPSPLVSSYAASATPPIPGAPTLPTPCALVVPLD
jgi:hypothetical protein